MPLVLRAQQTLEAQVAALQRAVRRLQRRPTGNDDPERVNTVAASGSTQTLPDVDQYTMHDITLTANCAITFPAATRGKSFALRLVQDGTGSRTVTWPASVEWDAGLTPPLSNVPGAVDTLWFDCFDGTRWEAGVGGLGHA